ncbi:hypothetical protein AAMO2058_000272200 [Amorphochlora amoebiformis]
MDLKSRLEGKKEVLEFLDNFPDSSVDEVLALLVTFSVRVIKSHYKTSTFTLKRLRTFVRYQHVRQASSLTKWNILPETRPDIYELRPETERNIQREEHNIPRKEQNFPREEQSFPRKGQKFRRKPLKPTTNSPLKQPRAKQWSTRYPVERREGEMNPMMDNYTEGGKEDYHPPKAFRRLPTEHYPQPQHRPQPRPQAQPQFQHQPQPQAKGRPRKIYPEWWFNPAVTGIALEESSEEKHRKRREEYRDSKTERVATGGMPKKGVKISIPFERKRGGLYSKLARERAKAKQKRFAYSTSSYHHNKPPIATAMRNPKRPSHPKKKKRIKFRTPTHLKHVKSKIKTLTDIDKQRHREEKHKSTNPKPDLNANSNPNSNPNRNPKPNHRQEDKGEMRNSDSPTKLIIRDLTPYKEVIYPEDKTPSRSPVRIATDFEQGSLFHTFGEERSYQISMDQSRSGSGDACYPDVDSIAVTYGMSPGCPVQPEPSITKLSTTKSNHGNVSRVLQIKGTADGQRPEEPKDSPRSDSPSTSDVRGVSTRGQVAFPSTEEQEQKQKQKHTPGGGESDQDSELLRKVKNDLEGIQHILAELGKDTEKLLDSDHEDKLEITDVETNELLSYIPGTHGGQETNELKSYIPGTHGSDTGPSSYGESFYNLASN